jgi:hypothetical protein
MSSVALENQTSQESTWYNPVRRTTIKRHQLVIDKFNELSKIKIKGMRPHPDDVMELVSEATGYAVGTIENILYRNRK